MDFALLILRLTVGLVVAGHGAQKLFGWFGGPGLKGTTGLLASQGFRPAGMWAIVGSVAEVGGGVLFVLGLWSPLGALGIAASMLTAIKIHWPKFWVTQGGFEYALANLAVAVAVGIAGSGGFSLDGVYGTALPEGAFPAGAILVILGWLVALVTSRAPAAAGDSLKRASQGTVPD